MITLSEERKKEYENFIFNVENEIYEGNESVDNFLNTERCESIFFSCFIRKKSPNRCAEIILAVYEALYG